MPIGLIVGDGAGRFEAVANGDAGPPLGRELEIADLLRFIRDRRIRNVVWITGDVHYCAAHHYHPSRARFTEFDPFWEFVAGPAARRHVRAGHARRRRSVPRSKFIGVPKGMKGNRPPSEGFQFFGTMKIDARTRAMTVRLHNLAGERALSGRAAGGEVTTSSGYSQASHLRAVARTHEPADPRPAKTICSSSSSLTKPRSSRSTLR